MDTLQSNTELSEDTVMLNYTLKKIDQVNQDLSSESHFRTAVNVIEIAAIIIVAILFYSKKK